MYKTVRESMEMQLGSAIMREDAIDAAIFAESLANLDALKKSPDSCPRSLVMDRLTAHRDDLVISAGLEIIRAYDFGH